MIKTVSISEAQAQLQGLLALARNGDEVHHRRKRRTFGAFDTDSKNRT